MGSFSIPNRCEKSFFYAPLALIESTDKSEDINVEVVSPLSDIHRDSVICDDPISPCVVALLSLRCPFTVVWGIVLSIVHSFNGHRIRTFAHIGNKIREPLLPSPPIADGYSSSSVTAENRVILIVASLPHSIPYNMLLCIRQAVNKACFRRSLFLKASATLRMTRFYFSSADNDGVSAITSTFPLGRPPPIFPREGKHHKLVESFSCYVREIVRMSHNDLPINALYARGG